MSKVPPTTDELGDVDQLYRRLSAQDAGRPGEWVRRKVQAYAAQQAAERAVRSNAKGNESVSVAATPAAPPPAETGSSFGRGGSFGACGQAVGDSCRYWRGGRCGGCWLVCGSCDVGFRAAVQESACCCRPTRNRRRPSRKRRPPPPSPRPRRLRSPSRLKFLRAQTPVTNDSATAAATRHRARPGAATSQPGHRMRQPRLLAATSRDARTRRASHTPDRCQLTRLATATHSGLRRTMTQDRLVCVAPALVRPCMQMRHRWLQADPPPPGGAGANSTPPRKPGSPAERGTRGKRTNRFRYASRSTAHTGG